MTGPANKSTDGAGVQGLPLARGAEFRREDKNACCRRQQACHLTLINLVRTCRVT
jgi:hypothetical protein